MAMGFNFYLIGAYLDCSGCENCHEYDCVHDCCFKCEKPAVLADCEAGRQLRHRRDLPLICSAAVPEKYVSIISKRNGDDLR